MVHEYIAVLSYYILVMKLFLCLCRMSPLSMTVTSWMKGTLYSPQPPLWPPPQPSSAAGSPFLWRTSGWICPRTLTHVWVSPSHCPSPRAHRVGQGWRRRHRRPRRPRHPRHPSRRRRSPGWDFDSLFCSITVGSASSAFLKLKHGKIRWRIFSIVFLYFFFHPFPHAYNRVLQLLSCTPLKYKYFPLLM